MNGYQLIFSEQLPHFFPYCCIILAVRWQKSYCIYVNYIVHLLSSNLSLQGPPNSSKVLIYCSASCQGRDDLSKAESCEPFPVAHHSFFKPESMPCKFNQRLQFGIFHNQPGTWYKKGLPESSYFKSFKHRSFTTVVETLKMILVELPWTVEREKSYLVQEII